MHRRVAALVSSGTVSNTDTECRAGLKVWRRQKLTSLHRVRARVCVTLSE